jgi:hypothetical protein
VTRLLLLLGLVAAAAAAEKVPLTGEQREEVVRLVGEELWGDLPAWRQRVILDRYGIYLRAPERKREAVERAGLRDFLLQPPRGAEEQRLPPPLAEAVGRLPPPVRPLARRLAFVRIRQLRLDRSLARVPPGDRRGVFLRLFPEPFDQAAANAACEDLRHREAKAFARALREELARREPPPTPEERREMVRRATREDEERIAERVRVELRPLEGADPDRARRVLERFLLYRLENLRFVTPRQRELIRYALRPEECPLLDPDFLGRAPEDPAERRQWEHDFRVLARLDLLSEAGLGREMVLHLAGAGSPEEFLRAIQAVR